MLQSGNDKSSFEMMKWVYVGYVRAHTHDVRALAMAVPISCEGLIFFLIPCPFTILFISLKSKVAILLSLYFLILNIFFLIFRFFI